MIICIIIIIQEIIDSGIHFDHIVFGCGSGGTAAGSQMNGEMD